MVSPPDEASAMTELAIPLQADYGRQVERKSQTGAGLVELAAGPDQTEDLRHAGRRHHTEHHAAVADGSKTGFEPGKQADMRREMLAEAAPIDHRRSQPAALAECGQQLVSGTGIGEDRDHQLVRLGRHGVKHPGRLPAAAAGATSPLMSEPRRDLLGLTMAEFTAWGQAVSGHAAALHRATYRLLVRSGRFAPAEIPGWQQAEAIRPGTLAAYAAAAAADQVPAITAQIATADPDLGTTRKVLCRLADGQEVEAVLIPMHHAGHHTVCVSSQVGCRMGCSFCHTAKMGLIRSLSAAEIVAQVVAVRRATGITPRNVVFMGMGEPLDNPEAVAQAVRVLSDGGGLALAQRHIALSTVGRVDGLRRWQALGLGRINLAISLTAADDDLRSALMPVNRLHPLAELKQALHALTLPPDRQLLISCVVIPGITDDENHTSRLVDWLAGLKVLVNLIPYNPIPSRPWRAPTAAEVSAVRDRLSAAGIPVRLRLTKGEQVMAACGQLGDPTRRKTSGQQLMADRPISR